jgi:thymidine phosphorylase
VVELKALRAGHVSLCNAQIIGEVIRDLGGGRMTKDSVINYDVGMDQIAKPGEYVRKNSVLARIHAASKDEAYAALLRAQSAFEIITAKPKTSPLIYGMILP